MAFNASNIPVESQEANQPVRIERFELIRDSAGAGRYRGGTGIRRDLRFFLAGRPAHQQHGAAPLRAVGALRRTAGPARRHAGEPGHARGAARAFQGLRHRPARDVVSFQQSGAGGYGPPWERDPRAVLRDVVEDYVSIEGARRDYGVVIDGATMAVDDAATRAARAAMRRSGPGPDVSRLGPLW